MLEQERPLKIGGATDALDAVRSDFKSLKAIPSPVEHAIASGQEKARK